MNPCMKSIGSHSKPDPYSIIVPYGDKVEKQHSRSIHIMNNIVSQDKNPVFAIIAPVLYTLCGINKMHVVRAEVNFFLIYR